MRSKFAALLLFAVALAVRPAAAIDVIVNSQVAIKSIPRGTLRAVFGMRLVKWPDGTPVSVFVLADGNPVHVFFCKEVLGIYPYQLRQSWDRLVYSGTGQAPNEVESEEEMQARVATTPGAIGYMRRSVTDERVRVVQVR